MATTKLAGPAPLHNPFLFNIKVLSTLQIVMCVQIKERQHVKLVPFTKTVGPKCTVHSSETIVFALLY